MKQLSILALSLLCVACKKEPDVQAPVDEPASIQAATPKDMNIEPGNTYEPKQEVFVGIYKTREYADTYYEFDTSFIDTVYITWVDLDKIKASMLVYDIVRHSSVSYSIELFRYQFQSKVTEPRSAGTPFTFDGDPARLVFSDDGKQFSFQRRQATNSGSWETTFVGQRL